MLERSGGGEKLFVELAGGDTRRDSELVTEAVRKLAVDVEGFGQVVLCRQRLHEIPVTALSQGGEANEVLTRSDGTSQFGTSQAESSGCIAFQRTQAKQCQLMTGFIDPQSVIAGQEVALGDEEGHQDGPPGPPPILLGGGGLGAMNGLDSGFEVDPGMGKLQLDSGATIQGLDAEHPAQFGKQGIEPGIYRRRVGFVPQGVGQLVAGDLAVTVENEVGEQQSPLASREPGLPPLVPVFDGQRSTDLDAQRVGRRQGHANSLAVHSARRLWRGETHGEADSVRMRIRRPWRQR